MSFSFCPTSFKKNKPATITLTSNSSMTGYTLTSVTFVKQNGNEVDKVNWQVTSFRVNNPSTTATIQIEKAKPNAVDDPEVVPPTQGDLTIDLNTPTQPVEVSGEITLTD